MKEINIYISKLGNIKENLIPKEQLKRVNTYKSLKAKTEALSGTTLLREVLIEKGINNPVFTHNKFGKPYLKDHTYYFNISHSYDYVSLAVANKEIGIDIELIDKKAARVKRKFTNLTTTGDEADFYTKLWVLKEGFMKWLGVGMTIPLKEIIINKTNQNNLYNVSYKNSETQCKVLKFKNYYIGVCINNVFDYEIKIEKR